MLVLLKDRGYEILEYNYNTKYGEIDVIAIDKSVDAHVDELVFVEVKFRANSSFGYGFEYIGKSKLAKLQRRLPYI